MFNVRLAGGHLNGKQLFTWLSLVVSFMASFVLSFFPLDVLDGIWDLIESVSEGFLTYPSINLKKKTGCFPFNKDNTFCDVARTGIEPGPLTYESDALQTALRDPAR